MGMAKKKKKEGGQKILLDIAKKSENRANNFFEGGQMTKIKTLPFFFFF